LFGAEPFSSLLRWSNLKMYKYDWYWNKSRPIGFLNVKKMPLKNIECISIFYKKQPIYNPQDVIEINKVKMNDNCKNGNNGTGLSGHNGGKMKGSYIQKYTNYPLQTLFFNSERGLHETQKPLALLEYLVKTYTNEGDMVLDNTMGSGTTNLACIKLNRKSIGIEKEKQYYDVAVRRASEYLIIDSYKNIQTKENYDKLLSSGMFWEFHPELSGNWDADRSVVQYCH
jgi:DNA modification methylase